MNSFKAIQQVQKALDDQGIIFYYSGYMTDDILVGIGATLRQKLELVHVDKSASRAIFAIFVEESQNIMRYSSGLLTDEDCPHSELRRGFIAIGKENSAYFVCCGNLIREVDVGRLNDQLKYISEMDQAQLKKYYRDVLRGETPDDSKGAGVGFIDIARRAKARIEFNFESIDDKLSYFFLKAFV